MRIIISKIIIETNSLELVKKFLNKLVEEFGNNKMKKLNLKKK